MSDLAGTVADSIYRLTTSWTPQQRRLYRSLFGLIARGRPVTDADIAASNDVEVEDIPGLLAPIDLMLQRDDDGHIIGWSGLTLKKTSHEFMVDGRRLNLWCALDAYFITAILGKPTQVISTDPVSGAKVTISLSADGVPQTEGVATLVTGEDGIIAADIIGSFCDYVHHFEGHETAARFQPDGPPVQVVDLTTMAKAAKALNARVWEVA